MNPTATAIAALLDAITAPLVARIEALEGTVKGPVQFVYDDKFTAAVLKVIEDKVGDVHEAVVGDFAERVFDAINDNPRRLVETIDDQLGDFIDDRTGSNIDDRVEDIIRSGSFSVEFSA